MKCNEQARSIHEFMCFDPRFGYTQGPFRWGTRTGEKATIKVNKRKYTFNAGDYDCSSSTITAWKQALKGTRYEGALNDATYTGNMRRVFVDSGLFEWKPMSFIAQPGDLYLNEVHHVGMCQSQVPDKISEFLSNEFGGSIGGQPGDQTGGESIVHDFWYPSFGWDGILHYNGKADLPDLPTVLEHYTDLDPEAWYIPYVKKCVENGWMTGSNYMWSPGDPLSRAEAIATIAKKDGWDSFGRLPFEDIGTWYTAKIIEAVERKIVDPSNENFFPDKPITREDFVTYLWREAGSPLPKTIVHEASPWAQESVGWAVEKGLITGTPRPKDKLLRAEAAAIISRL